MPQQHDPIHPRRAGCLRDSRHRHQASSENNSYIVPLDTLREHRAEFTVEHDDLVVLLCASGTRADQARTVLETAGLDQLSVLKGGGSDGS
ncbi:MAG: rhodanese-like domain-containing protein [Pseudonocardiaceae bacterium]